MVRRTMTEEERKEGLKHVEAAFREIIPTPPEGKVCAPIINGYTVTSSPELDGWLEEVAKSQNTQLTQPLLLRKGMKGMENADGNKLAIHTKHFKENIVVAHFRGLLDWKTFKKEELGEYYGDVDFDGKGDD